jgi:hypothetical protein
MTARELIKGSLRLLGVIAQGETPSADEMADGLFALNDMVDSWSTENLIIPARVREVFILTSGQQLRTMGPSGNFNTTRPIEIESATIEVQDAGGLSESPLDIINLKQWSEISEKNVESSIPTKLYIEHTSPLLKLYFWPVPSAANKAVLYSSKPLTSFANLNDTITLPPGYQKALKYNLAIDLGPEYGRTPSAEIVNGAVESKENIKRRNIKPVFMECDSAVLSCGSGFDYRTGD